MRFDAAVFLSVGVSTFAEGRYGGLFVGLFELYAEYWAIKTLIRTFDGTVRGVTGILAFTIATLLYKYLDNMRDVVAGYDSSRCGLHEVYAFDADRVRPW